MSDIKLTPAAVHPVNNKPSAAVSGDQARGVIGAPGAGPAAGSGPSRDDLMQAVAEMNQYIQNEQRDLQFSVDESSGHTIVRVVERNSGDLIRQIPNEVVIDLARHARSEESPPLISIYG